MKNIINKLSTFAVNIVAIIYVIFDEIFVYCSNTFTLFLQHIPKLDRLFDIINSILSVTNKYVLLCYFMVLLAISELMGIAAFMELANNNIPVFIALYTIKFIPFFIMNYIFKETKDRLLTIVWFNYCYLKIVMCTTYLKNVEVIIKVKAMFVNIKIKIFK